MRCKLFRRQLFLLLYSELEWGSLAFLFLRAFHFLFGNTKAFTVSDVQVHFPERSPDNASGLPHTQLSSLVLQDAHFREAYRSDILQ